MIPKLIHYCWFGGKPLPENLVRYIETWRKFCPDYEIKLWDEKSFEIDGHEFTKSAYANGKFAYVSDYVRAFALYNEGGIYLDTDVELKAGLDSFLVHEAFTGFESKGMPFTALWASIPKHSLTYKVLNYYEGRRYSPELETNTASVSRILINDFGVNPDVNSLQIGSDGRNAIHIYPAEYFCLDLLPNYATHHFVGSWKEKNIIPFKNYLHQRYYVEKMKNECADEFVYLLMLSEYLNFSDIYKVFLYKIYNKFPVAIKKFIKIFFKR